MQPALDATLAAWRASVPPEAKLLLLAIADGDDLHQAAARCGFRTAYARMYAGMLRDLGHLDENDQVVIPAAPPRPERPPSDYVKAPIPSALRAAVLLRDEHTCQGCGVTLQALLARGENLCCDHIIAEWKGGPTTLENLQALCPSCNSSKGTRSMEDWEERRRLRDQPEGGVAAA